MKYFPGLVLMLLAMAPSTSFALATECDGWQQAHPEWLWCDDFESDAALEQNYFDVNRVGGRFGVVSDTAFGGTHSLRNAYATGAEDAGGIKFSFGNTPVYPKRYTDRKFDEVYWRFYIKTAPNWVGQPMKVSRATIFVSSNWAQAAIGHLWEDNALGLGLDPVSLVSGSSVVSTKWNDFDHMTWLGKADGPVQIYSAQNRDQWFCIEAHMKLNTPGSSDGVFEFWNNATLQARKGSLNFRGSYTAYGINALTLEAWTNGGPPQNQNRYFDNLVVSTARIGCYSTTLPKSPTNLSVN